MRRPGSGLILLLALCWMSATPLAFELPAGSRLLATGGATQLEGQSGGGIVPWAVLAGYGADGEVGASAFYTRVEVADYALDATGIALSFDNRIELSLARQDFHLGTLGKAIGRPGDSLRQDVVGLKARLFGDLVLGELPQVVAGMTYKRHLDFNLPQAVGARHGRDAEFYLGAAKLWLNAIAGRNVFANLNVRHSRANQLGLLGFGGDREDDRVWLVEAAAGVFLHRRLAIGAEYRQQPDNLAFSASDDWFDAFVALFPARNLALVAAYADLGTVATLDDQRGWYLSLQVSF